MQKSLNFHFLSFIKVFAISLVFFSCNSVPDINEQTMLDGNLIQDSSILHPDKFLVSHQFPNPSDSLKKVPVVICMHGFSASTPEWKEFRTFLSKQKAGMVSLVLMGGHGRNYEAFKNSTWEEWQQPILDEYRRLTYLGYTNISLAGSSTGGTLLVELLANNKLKGLPAPNQVILVDPFIVSVNKTLRYVHILKYFKAYVESGIIVKEEGSWYNYRPAHALAELQTIVAICQKELKQGFELPIGTELSVYKASNDPDADIKAVDLIKQGVKDSSKLRVLVVDSEKHVFTRLILRDAVSQKDIDNQAKAFTDMLKHIKR